MLPRTDIEAELKKIRKKRVPSEAILDEVGAIFEQNRLERDVIEAKLKTGNSNPTYLDWTYLEAGRLFHLDDIRSLCITYRLRFLDSHFFKGKFPAEAISKIRQLEQQQNVSLSGLKVMAPAKLLKLENADDPLLFAPVGNDYFYLIHKWGNDLHPLRRLLMWPYKSFENLVFSVFLISMLLTAITPMGLFTKGEVTTQEYVLMFLFLFKAVAGIVLFYGFAKGKNFNSAIWDSKYYNA